MRVEVRELFYFALKSNPEDVGMMGRLGVSWKQIVGVRGKQIDRRQCNDNCPSNSRRYWFPIPGSNAHRVIDQLAFSTSLVIRQLVPLS